MTWKGSTTWVGSGEDDRIDRRIRARHVQGAIDDALLPALGLFVQPGGHIGEGAAGQDVDDLVMLDVGHRRGVGGVGPGAEAHEGGLVQSDGRRLVHPLAIRLEQGLAVGDHGVVDRVPVTGQLVGHLEDRSAPSDLARRPLGSPRREQAVLGRDPMVLEHPGPLGTRPVHTAHPVLLPRQRHRRAIDGQVDVVDHRALFDPSPGAARRTSNDVEHLFDHELDVGTSAVVREDADVFEAHQGTDDLARVGDDEGASGMLAHTTTLEHHRQFPGDLRQGAPR